MGMNLSREQVQKVLQTPGVVIHGGSLVTEATALPSGISEKAFTAEVIRVARMLGWLVAHFRAARVLRRGVEKYETPVAADGKGFVDLVLVRERVLWVELKTDTGKLRPEQERWRDRLADAGQWVAVWRPDAWPDIQRLLGRIP